MLPLVVAPTPAPPVPHHGPLLLPSSTGAPWLPSGSIRALGGITWDILYGEALLAGKHLTAQQVCKQACTYTMGDIRIRRSENPDRDMSIFPTLRF